MSDYLTTSNPEEKARLDALEKAVNDLGSAFHEDWRQTRLNEDGSFEPRIKETSDLGWIESNGTDKVDIANTPYDQLPKDWQAENKAAAEVVVKILTEREGSIDLSDSRTRSELGGIVHDAWLSRNKWALGGELDKPFDELPADEQDKDISQIKIAIELFDSGSN